MGGSAILPYTTFGTNSSTSTTIRFDLKQSSAVTLEIYNILGQRVESWNYGTMEAGRYNKVVDMERFASGVYYYRIVASPQSGIPSGQGNDRQNFVAVKKLILMK